MSMVALDDAERWGIQWAADSRETGMVTIVFEEGGTITGWENLLIGGNHRLLMHCEEWIMQEGPNADHELYPMQRMPYWLRNWIAQSV